MPAPEKLIIDTPEQIALEYALAGAGSRFLALGLDTLIQFAAFALLILVGVFTSWGGLRGMRTWVLALLVVAGFTVYYGYFAIFELVWSGQTPGKRAVGIRVIVESGRSLGPFDAILRNLLRVVDQLPGLYAVGLVSIFLTSRNQRLGDLAAGTVVVHDRPIEQPLRSPAAERTLHYGAARLTIDELALVEAFLDRRTALDPQIRLATSRRIVERLQRRLGLPAETSRHDERMLEEIVREYRTGS